MLKKDLKAGVLYGYAVGTSDYRSAKPIILLDVKGLWFWGRRGRGEHRIWKVSNEKRYTAPLGGWSSYSGAHGYLALHGSRYLNEEQNAANLETLKSLYEEFAATAGNPDAVNALDQKVRNVEGVTMEAVNNRWIEGTYDDATNAQAKRDEERKAHQKAERDRSAAEQEFMNEVASIIEAKTERTGVSVMRDYNWNGRVSISTADLAAFLGIKTPSQRL